MMGRERREINPVLIKFGVALAISFAGFLYARLRNKRTPPPRPPPSSRCSERCSDVGAQSGLKSNLQTTPTIYHRASNASDRYEVSFVPRVAVDNPIVGLSPSSKSVDKEGYLLSEFNDLVEEFDLSAGISPKKNVETPRPDAEMPKAFKSLEADRYEQEIMHLKNTVRTLRERERNLEVQLLEYYGLKEQESAVMELQNRLKLNNMEAKLFSLKIDSLQTDNQRLETQVADYSRITGELDSAKAKIKILKRKLRFEAEHNKEQIITLQNRVAKLLEEEQKNAVDDHSVQLKLQKLNGLEMEAEELRKSNLKLQFENSELARRLESTQILATGVLEDHEAEELKEISCCLKQKNEDLAKEIERLQAGRCADVEELVYLRWINACLRFELRNYQPLPGQTVARDLSKTLSPKSEEKAKQLILEYAKTEGGSNAGISIIDFDSDWSASLNSYLTDSGEPDDSPCDSSSINGTNSTRKLKLLKKLRKLVHSKDSRRHSKDLGAERTSLSDDIMQTYPSDSSRYSSSNDVGADEQSSKFTCSSWHLSRKSLDIPKQKCPSKEETNELARVERSQSNLASPDGPKRYSLNRGSVSERHDEDLNGVSKAELIKYAEALKDTTVGSPKMYKLNSFKSC